MPFPSFIVRAPFVFPSPIPIVGTAGAVLFDGGGFIDEDNLNLFWDNFNDFLGVGTNTPTSPLHVDHASVPQVEIHQPAALSGAGLLLTSFETGPGLGNGLLLSCDGFFGGSIFLYEALSLKFGTFGVDRWEIDSSGDLLPDSDFLYSIGSALKRVDDLYLFNTLFLGSTTLAAFGGGGALDWDFTSLDVAGTFINWAVPLITQAVGLVSWSLGGGGSFFFDSAGDPTHYRYRITPTTVVPGWEVKTTSGGVGGPGLTVRHTDHTPIVGATIGAGTTEIGHSVRPIDTRVGVSGEVVGYEVDMPAVLNTAARKITARLKAPTPCQHEIETQTTYSRRVSTVGAVTATLWTETLPATGTWQIEAWVTAQRTNGDDHAGYWRRAVIYRQGGGVATIVMVAQTPAADRETSATWDVTLGVDGLNNAQVTVTGIALHNITWVGTIKRVGEAV